MGAPAHFTQIKTARELWEPVHKSLYEISWILPEAINDRDPLLLLENAKSLGGIDVTKEIKIVDQRYKYSTRIHPTLPDNTHLESISVSFNLNQTDKNSVIVYNTLRAWYDLMWNSQTGETQYKRDLVGTMIVNQHDKKGVITRRIILQNVMLRSLQGYGNDRKWEETGDIFDIEATFSADYWDDIYIDEL